ncbi:hypothetical protein CEW88_11595 [Alloyangia pacifica]|uniref:Uncharacterized protein n=1 Tax=Alloyangia pacifica TaxID=311180 RepID=A0A2U8HEM5_9RHOB|nr:hypothetical protein [Alloyangia pacifica]AWI84271.1 hypothetical protein CEW88_11595 [Alloyangia pacifica]
MAKCPTRPQPPTKTSTDTPPTSESEDKPAEVLTIHDGGKPPQWPAPSIPLKGPALEHYGELCNTVWNAKGGLLVTDLKRAEIAARAYGETIRWANVSELLLSEAAKAGIRPDLRSLAAASDQQTRAARAWSSATNQLGLEGRHLGLEHNKRLRANVGTDRGDSKWKSVLQAGTIARSCDDDEWDDV